MATLSTPTVCLSFDFDAISLWIGPMGAKSPSMISWNRRVPLNFSDITAWPDTIMFSARCNPMARGRRWVPPAPGSRPSLTSGSPHFPEPFLATRRSAANATVSRTVDGLRMGSTR